MMTGGDEIGETRVLARTLFVTPCQGPVTLKKGVRKMENLVKLRTNRHPADELAEIRAQIKLLSLREEELRAQILASDESELTGYHYRARVDVWTNPRFDYRLLRETFPSDQLESCTKIVETRRVTLEKRTKDEEEI